MAQLGPVVLNTLQATNSNGRLAGIFTTMGFTAMDFTAMNFTAIAACWLSHRRGFFWRRPRGITAFGTISRVLLLRNPAKCKSQGGFHGPSPAGTGEQRVRDYLGMFLGAVSQKQSLLRPSATQTIPRPSVPPLPSTAQWVLQQDPAVGKIQALPTSGPLLS